MAQQGILSPNFRATAKCISGKLPQRILRGLWLMCVLAILGSSSFAFAENAPEIKGRLALKSPKSGVPEFRVEPSSLRDGSVITLITPAKWSSIGGILVETLKTVHIEFTQQLGDLIPINTSLRVLPETLFYQTTGAPSWTNALYYRGQVFIPLSEKSALDQGNLIRSARHEYVHAIINGLSAGKCPGWLDEGLAQSAEGPENPALRPALVRYLKNSNPLPFSMLQGGFTRLETRSVAAAYAESLIATLAIKKTFGFQSIRSYLDNLRNGDDKQVAFKNAFGVSEAHFEGVMNQKLGDWALQLE